MTKIARFKTLDNSDDFTKILKDKNLLIYEDIQGSKIFVKWNGKKFIIKSKSLKSDSLNFIDLTVQKYYNQAFINLHTLPGYVTELLNPNWWFMFEYFPDSQPGNILYTRIPKNNLILTSIVKKNNYIYDYDEILEYSNLFEVEPLPVLFKGKLIDKQLEVIELYLNTKEEDLKFVFGEDNFAYFFYKILNPKIENSFLMNNEEFNNNLEKIVIKIDKNEKYSFEILNPLYSKMEFQNNSEYVEIYSLILLKFLEFIQLIDIDKIKIGKITKEELYIEVISQIFNQYMESNEKNLLEWNFAIPKFFKEDKFKINTDLLSNEKTVQYVKSDEKIEYIFKCILGSFQKKKKKIIGIFTENTLKIFNNFVTELSKIIDKNLKINRERELQKSDLINFRDYFNLKYETDADGEMYFPDVFDEFYDGEEKKKKKGKKKTFKKGQDEWSDEDLKGFNIKDEKL